MNNQKTIKGKVSFQGSGLHTGQDAKVEILPASPDTGIVFRRRDIESSPLIKASFYSILEPKKFPRCTSIGIDGVQIHTVEHLMAAFHILGIDNAQVDIWGSEVPGLDGSAKDFINKFEEVGLEEQNLPKKFLAIKEPLWVEDDPMSIVILPYHTFRVSYILDYSNPVITSGYVDVVIDGKAKNNFYQARTFCLEEEVESLLEMGMGKGANYKNTLVVSENGVIDNELRFDDEFAKHKILDLVGDIYLAGSIRGHVIAVKGGHSLNMRLLQKLCKYSEKTRRAGVGSKISYIPESEEFGVEEIMKILPHRYPFLLVDKIVHLEKGKKAIGLKNVTMNENFFQGHFPGRPVMPGVLIVESMAQVGGVLMLACPEHRGKLAFFMAANNIKFRKTVLPGDQLIIEVVVGKVRSKTGIVNAKAFVDDKLVAEGELMFALVDS